MGPGEHNTHTASLPLALVIACGVAYMSQSKEKKSTSSFAASFLASRISHLPVFTLNFAASIVLHFTVTNYAS